MRGGAGRTSSVAPAFAGRDMRRARVTERSTLASGPDPRCISGRLLAGQRGGGEQRGDARRVAEVAYGTREGSHPIDGQRPPRERLELGVELGARRKILRVAARVGDGALADGPVPQDDAYPRRPLPRKDRVEPVVSNSGHAVRQLEHGRLREPPPGELRR